VEVDRGDKFFRGNRPPEVNEFSINSDRTLAKAHVMSHSYINEIVDEKQQADYKNNMGDPRQTLYFRSDKFVIADNAYPSNVSPNRRNIRNASIYRDATGADRIFGRVLPSEWPDGGHNVTVTSIPAPGSGTTYDPSNTTSFRPVTNSREGMAPTFISNRGRFFSATELGRVFDPVMYAPEYEKKSDTDRIVLGFMPPGQFLWPSIDEPLNKAVSNASNFYGGGNTLRIGRPEHPLFSLPKLHAPNAMPDQNAARLLDLFHAGESRSDAAADREGPTVRIEGHVNINTATVDSLRALAGGLNEMDPRLSTRSSDSHSQDVMAPLVSQLKVSAPTRQKEADIVAEAIIRGRPYSSPSEIATALDDQDDQAQVVMGNRLLLNQGKNVQWSDAAAEELFARVYNSSTVRSRNFRIWIVGQAVAATEVSATNPEVLSEVRRAYTVFADPGQRKADGTIDLTKTKLTILNENDF
jgi:hypothetical protein